MLKLILILGLVLVSCHGERDDNNGFRDIKHMFPGFTFPELLRNPRSFEENPGREERSFQDIPGGNGFGQFDQNGQEFGHQGQFQNKDEFRSQREQGGEREGRHGLYDTCGNGCGGGYGPIFSGGGGGSGCYQIIYAVQYLYQQLIQYMQLLQYTCGSGCGIGGLGLGGLGFGGFGGGLGGLGGFGGGLGSFGGGLGGIGGGLGGFGGGLGGIGGGLGGIGLGGLYNPLFRSARNISQQYREGGETDNILDLDGEKTGNL